MSAGTFYDRLTSAGHSLIRNEGGDVDIFAFAEGFHNGPMCEICRDSWCEHCPNASISPCDGGEWSRAYDAKRLVEAAAPELLKALQSARKLIDDLGAAFPDADQKFDGTWASYRDEFEAAIDLATGESSLRRVGG